MKSRPLGILRRNRRGIAAKLDSSFPQARGRMIRQVLAYFVDARLLAAGTGVEYEDFHIWAGAKLLRFLAIWEATDLPNAKASLNSAIASNTYPPGSKPSLSDCR